MLWAVLIVAVLVLGAMAWRLSKQMKALSRRAAIAFDSGGSAGREGSTGCRRGFRGSGSPPEDRARSREAAPARRPSACDRLAPSGGASRPECRSSGRTGSSSSGRAPGCRGHRSPSAGSTWATTFATAPAHVRCLHWAEADGVNGAGNLSFFSVLNTSSSVPTVSISWTTGSAGIASYYEVSPGAVFLNSGTAKTGSGSLTSLGFTITPSGGSPVVIAVGVQAFATGLGTDSGYTFPSSANVTFPIALNNDNHVHEYDASASGLQSLNFTGTGSGGASMFGAAYGTTVIVTPTSYSLESVEYF